MTNLIRDPWLKGLRASGRQTSFAPWQMTETEDPLLDVLAPRPDLRASMVHFLVGLLQTVLEPRTESEWRARYRSPPTPEELRGAMERVAHAFDLEADVAFMQEQGLRGEELAIGDLLFGAATGNTLRRNADLLVKRRGDDAFCPGCTASLLYALQSQAASGGAGHRVGLRGGGPLATLVEGARLWRRCWLNVLPRESWLPDRPRGGGAGTFPWLESAPDVPDRGTCTLADSEVGVHYWAMPRRILLRWQHDAGRCTLCGKATEALARGAVQRPYGVKYDGSWEHPLSPTYEKDGARIAIKGGRAASGYRHWKAFIMGTPQDGRRPAPIVGHLWRRRADELGERSGWRLWIHGFETDKASILGWYEDAIPDLHVPPGTDRDAYEERVERLLAGAQLAATYLSRALHDALGERPPDGSRFWARSRDDFHEALVAALDPDPKTFLHWRQKVEQHAVGTFAVLVPIASIADDRPGRVARAERQLLKNLRGPKMKAALQIPIPEVTP